jgi:hypothetical protein
MATYCQEVHGLEDKFDGLELNHVPRRLNKATNELAKMASSREPVATGVFASNQHQPSIRYEEPEQADLGLHVSGLGASSNNQHLASRSEANPPTGLPYPEVMDIDKEPPARPDPLPDWRVPYLDCLVRETLSVDKTEARWLARRAKSFAVIRDDLYRKSHTGILQRCIPTE